MGSHLVCKLIFECKEIRCVDIVVCKVCKVTTKQPQKFLCFLQPFPVHQDSIWLVKHICAHTLDHLLNRDEEWIFTSVYILFVTTLYFLVCLTYKLSCRGVTCAPLNLQCNNKEDGSTKTCIIYIYIYIYIYCIS